MSDGVGLNTGEQLPLFSIFGRDAVRPVWEVWGLLGYAIPLLPFVVAWAAPRERRGPALVVAGWCAWFGALALVQSTQQVQLQLLFSYFGVGVFHVMKMCIFGKCVRVAGRSQRNSLVHRGEEC